MTGLPIAEAAALEDEVERELSRLPRAQPSADRNLGGGWRSGDAPLSAAPRQANPRRVPPAAVAFWQRHAHLAPTPHEVKISSLDNRM